MAIHPHLNPAKPIKVKGTHFSGDDLPKIGRGRRYRVRLEKGQTAWLPGTTKKLLHGPGAIVYQVWADGIDGKIEAGSVRYIERIKDSIS